MSEPTDAGHEARTDTDVSPSDKSPELTPGDLAEGLHFMYDSPIAGFWVTTAGYLNGRVAE